MKFSICTSVYRNDNPEYVRQAFDSLIWQTLRPDEIVVVIDGPVPEALYSLVQEYTDKYPVFKIVEFKDNRGLGQAMRTAVEVAKYDIVARMDSDDIAVPNRFEEQLMFLEKNPDITVVGGQIDEFIDSPGNIVGSRIVPQCNEDIYKYIKSRCPFNHMTVMFRKADVLAVGNYQDWHYNEDYYLWIRMAEAGCKFANLPDTLVNVRVGKDMYQRRGGWKYFRSEAGLQRYMLQRKIISLPRYLYNVFGRFVIQVAMPNGLRGFVFQNLFRK